jgi:two-component system sensor histidine kinase UhpB
MIALAVLIIVGVGTLFVIHNARRSVWEEVRSSVNMALQLIDAAVAHQTGDRGPPMAWIAELAHMEKTRHLRIHVRQVPEGLIQLDAPPSLSAHADVPEWFAWAVTPEPMVGEKQLLAGDAPVRITLEADPEDEIAEAWTEAKSFLFLIVSLALAVAVLVHVTLGQAFRPVGIILQGLGRIERGDYDEPLPPFSLPEFARISAAVNHMARVLAKTRAENRALTQQSLTIQEEERRHIARELHDELGQSVSGIKAMAASLRKVAGHGAAGEAVESIIETCDRLFDVVRTLMQRLRPSLLDEFGLAASLDDMVSTWRARNPGVRLDFHCEAGVEECAGDARIHLFRIVQECLTNVFKHADARKVRIRLRPAKRGDIPWIDLEVKDDGRGFAPDQPHSGFGLSGMKERVTSLGGEFAVHSAPGEGVTVAVRVPCAGGDG